MHPAVSCHQAGLAQVVVGDGWQLSRVMDTPTSLTMQSGQQFGLCYDDICKLEALKSITCQLSVATKQIWHRWRLETVGDGWQSSLAIETHIGLTI
jgi:hypothetical protein